MYCTYCTVADCLNGNHEADKSETTVMECEVRRRSEREGGGIEPVCVTKRLSLLEDRTVVQETQSYHELSGYQ